MNAALRVLEMSLDTFHVRTYSRCVKGKGDSSLLRNDHRLIAVTKILLCILSFHLLEVAVHAQPPSHGGIKILAEQQDPTNSIPHGKRIYFCTEWPLHEESFIRRFQDGLTIRQVIDQTKFKDKKVEVEVYRRDDSQATRDGSVFSSVVDPTNTPAFQLKAEDAILLLDPAKMHAF